MGTTPRSLRLVRTVTPMLAVLTVALSAGPASAGQRIHETPVPTPQAGPLGIARGSGGDMWFTESIADAVGVMHKDGSIQEFPLPAGSRPQQIALGPDGNMWFTLLDANEIDRITPAGKITSFPVPTTESGPFGITAGPDGNLWFTESEKQKIGRITPKGAITEFRLVLGFNVGDITLGPDGALWYTRLTNPEKSDPGFIGRITTTGSITEVPSTGVEDPVSIATGSDGNLWVTGATNGVVAKVTPDFDITPFALPDGPLSNPLFITAGPDGALWFTEAGVSPGPRATGELAAGVPGNKVGRITTAGKVREFTIPTSSSGPADIAVGRHGTVWFAEEFGDKLGRIKTS